MHQKGPNEPKGLLPPVHAVLLSALTDSDIRTLGFSRYRY